MLHRNRAADPTAHLRLLLIAAALLAALPSTADGRWQPRPTTAPWQWQLQGRIDTSVAAPVYEIDGFDVGKQVVRKLHRQGRRAICYLDIGSWESYRPDAGRFPESVKGKRYEGYPRERWLDIRRIGVLTPILDDRFDRCARKGFDAVEPDNVNGYTNDTGFPLTGKDQLRFNRWVAEQVHRRGMSVALKNDGEQADALAGDFDFAVVEQCFQYDECGAYARAFVAAGKAVFEAEYELPPSRFCQDAERLRFSAIRKSYDLFARPWQPCG